MIPRGTTSSSKRWRRGMRFEARCCVRLESGWEGSRVEIPGSTTPSNPRCRLRGRSRTARRRNDCLEDLIRHPAIEPGGRIDPEKPADERIDIDGADPIDPCSPPYSGS